MSRRRSSLKRAKKAVGTRQNAPIENKAKIKRPKQNKINKQSITSAPTQLSGSLPLRADLSKVKAQAMKMSKKTQQRVKKQNIDIDIDKMFNKAVNSKISKQHYEFKEKANAEVARMAKVLNKRLDKFKNEDGFDERRERLDEEARRKAEEEKAKFDSGRMSEDDLHDSKYYEGYQVYQQILEMIREAESPKNPPYMPKHGEALYEALQKEIREFGFDRVMKSMAEAPEELIYYARRSIEDSDDENSRSYRYHLVALIESNIPDIDEAKDINDYEESNREQSSEDYDRAEDTGWATVTENDIPEDW